MNGERGGDGRRAGRTRPGGDDVGGALQQGGRFGPQGKEGSWLARSFSRNIGRDS